MTTKLFNEGFIAEQEDGDDPLSILLAIEALQPHLLKELQAMTKKTKTIDNLSDLSDAIVVDSRSPEQIKIDALIEAKAKAQARIDDLKVQLPAAHNALRSTDDVVKKLKARIAVVPSPELNDKLNIAADAYIEASETYTNLQHEIEKLHIAVREATMQINSLVIEQRASTLKLFSDSVLEQFEGDVMLTVYAQLAQSMQSQIEWTKYSYAADEARLAAPVTTGVPEFDDANERKRLERIQTNERLIDSYVTLRRLAERGFHAIEAEMPEGAYIPALYRKTDSEVGQAVHRWKEQKAIQMQEQRKTAQVAARSHVDDRFSYASASRVENMNLPNLDAQV